MHLGSSQLILTGKHNLPGKTLHQHPAPSSLPAQPGNHCKSRQRDRQLPCSDLDLYPRPGNPSGFVSRGHTGTSSAMFLLRLFTPSACQGQPAAPQRHVTSTVPWEETRTGLAWVLLPGCTVTARDAGVPSLAVTLESL